MNINRICHIVFCGRLGRCFRGRAILDTTSPGFALWKPCKSRTFQPLTVHSRPPFPFTFCFLPPVNSGGAVGTVFRPAGGVSGDGLLIEGSGQIVAVDPVAHMDGLGGVGIRNEIWIIPTVGCVNSVAETLARIVSRDIRGSVTGVYAWPHPYGCSQTGDDQEHTRRILCDLICHPNAGGVLVLGLGCENSNIGELKKLLGDWDPERIAFLECQSVPDELEAGKVLLRRLIGHAAKDVRCSIPVSELVVGLKCGGSDGLSGITANPLVGRIADRLVAMGGTALLAEVPEMFGAEGVLFRRCADETVQKELPALVADFKEYFVRHGQVVYENPSPGNKAGGITTLEEKSLGCVQRGGSSPICGVLPYGQRVQNRGLTVLQTPGNDLVSTTAPSSGAAIASASTIWKRVPPSGAACASTTGRTPPFRRPSPPISIGMPSLTAPTGSTSLASLRRWVPIWWRSARRPA